MSMGFSNLEIIRSKKLLIILSIISVLLIVLDVITYIQKKNPNLWSEIFNKSKSSSQSASEGGGGYLYFNKYVSTNKVFDLSLVRVNANGASEKELVKATNVGNDYFNFPKMSPDQMKIYVPSVGIYDLKTQKTTPYTVKAPAKQDCTWFNNSEKLACIYNSNYGALKETVKITIIDLLGKEDVQFEKNISDTDNSLFYAFLFPLGVRNDSEIIFRSKDASIFIKYDLKTKKFSFIYDYRGTIKTDFGNFGDRVSEGQTDMQNSAIYLNSLDKIAFLREIKISYDQNDPKSTNQYAGILSLLDLKTGKVEKLYSTGFSQHYGSIENLKTSIDEKMLGFQFYLGADNPSNEKDEFVIIDLTTNKKKVVDFPPLKKPNSYGDSHFKGFSNNKEPLFEFNLNSSNSKNVTFDYQTVRYNIETKVTKKVISLSTTVPLSSLSSGNSSESGLYGYNLAQVW